MERFLIRTRPVIPVANKKNRCSSSSSSSSSENSQSPPKKKPIKRKFRSVWSEQFPWLRNNDGSSFCTACEKTLSNHLSYLKKHGSLPLHVQNFEKKKNQLAIETFINNEETIISKQVKYAELTLVMFLISHNLPFLLMDFLPALLKECCSDSKIAAALQCARTKSTVVAEILGNKAKEKLVSKLKSTKFSLIVDETTDLSSRKCLALIVRYFDKLTQSVCDSFLSLIELTKCDASSIYESIKSFFCQHDIPLKNVIGLATDGANVMAAELNGLKAKFKPDADIFYIKCACHSLHLCSAYACKQLPHEIEDLCRNIYSFFAHSPKRIDELKEFQDYCNIQPHKILGVSLTRWLSLEQVINRIIEQWNPLYLFFLNKTLEVNGIKTLIFLFLSYILKIINDLNKEFQSEKVRLPYLYMHLEMKIKLIASNFMDYQYLKNLNSLENINYHDENNHLPIEKIFTGAKTERYLDQSEMSTAQKREIKKNILNFYLELLKQIHKRFDFSRADLQNLAIITPCKVLSESEVSIELLLDNFSNLVEGDVEEIISQWRLLRLSQLDLQKDMDITDFWIKVSSIKNGMGQSSFKELFSFICNLLALPHSSAAAERQFSNLALIKTKLRNKLSTKTVNSIMNAKELYSHNMSHTVWSAKEQFN